MGENEAEAFALMDRAFDAGINFFDTANAYGGGRSESCIGKWLRAKGSAVRQQLLVSSKVFNPVGPGPNDRGLSRRHILQQVDESLARLQTDRLDLYLIHEPDPETPLEETLAALHDLVRTGKVLYVGASNIEAWRLARALWISDVRKLARFEWVQNSYSLLDRTPEREMFPLCDECGVGFTAFSPLAGGWLTGKYRSAGAYPAGSRMTLRPEPYAHLVSDRVFRGSLGVRRRSPRARRRHHGARDRLGAAPSTRRRGHHRSADARAPRRRVVDGVNRAVRRRRRSPGQSVLKATVRDGTSQAGALNPRSVRAVPPRMASRSASLRNGVARTWSTGASTHG